MNEPAEVRATPQGVELPGTIRIIPGVSFGYITVRYENGRPTMVERHEQVKLRGGKPEDG